MESNIKHRIKVLFLASWYPTQEDPVSGIFIKRHAQAVLKYCDVAVLYIHKSRANKVTFVEYAVEDGIKTVRVYPRSAQFDNRFLRYAANLFYWNIYINSFRGLEVIKKEFGKPDIIHVNVCLPMGILAVALDICKEIPYVITEHYSRFAELTQKKSSIILKIILERSRRIAPVSEHLKQTMTHFYKSDKYVVIPNVINTDLFCCKNPGEIHERKRILHVSLFNDKVKNISGIINAIYYISKIRIDFELHIIGDGPDRTYLENLADQLGIKNSLIFFHGRFSTSEVINSMSNSDIFILNSNFETFSVVCAEALASGIPVISTRCGGPEEFIDQNVGILIEKGDTNELVNAIGYMLDNSEKYDPKMLHDYVKKKFGYEVVGKQFYAIYSSIVSK